MILFYWSFNNILTFIFEWWWEIILAKKELFTFRKFNLSFLLDSWVNYPLSNTLRIIINFILFRIELQILIFTFWGNFRKILFRIGTILVSNTHDLVRDLIMSGTYGQTLAVFPIFDQIKQRLLAALNLHISNWTWWHVDEPLSWIGAYINMWIFNWSSCYLLSKRASRLKTVWLCGSIMFDRMMIVWVWDKLWADSLRSRLIRDLRVISVHYCGHLRVIKLDLHEDVLFIPA